MPSRARRNSSSIPTTGAIEPVRIIVGNLTTWALAPATSCASVALHLSKMRGKSISSEPTSGSCCGSRSNICRMLHAESQS